ncbi:acyltransferase domain-containing protein [Glaciimonas sp. GNP009]
MIGLNGFNGVHVAHQSGPTAAPVVWMFSGQGAQYFQMGRSLYDENAVFRHWMDKLDAVAADYVGQSIVAMLYDPAIAKSAPFEQTLYTHPALFMLQYAMAQTLLAENFPPPDILLGASLGEFVAAALADIADVEDMLFDVIKQARLFEAYCSGGAMLLVIDQLDTFRTNPAFSGDNGTACELAGVNFDRCFVVSGLRGDILEIAERLRRQDVTHQILPVSTAFHSSQVDVAQDTFGAMFGGRANRPSAIPIVSCAPDMGDGIERFSAAYWWQVIRQPIQFRQTLAGFRQKYPLAVYLDLGPAGNMATFTKYNLPAEVHHRILPVMTPFGRDADNLRAARKKLQALVVTDTDTHTEKS